MGRHWNRMIARANSTRGDGVACETAFADGFANSDGADRSNVALADLAATAVTPFFNMRSDLAGDPSWFADTDSTRFRPLIVLRNRLRAGINDDGAVGRSNFTGRWWEFGVANDSAVASLRSRRKCKNQSERVDEVFHDCDLVSGLSSCRLHPSFAPTECCYSRLHIFFPARSRNAGTDEPAFGSFTVFCWIKRTGGDSRNRRAPCIKFHDCSTEVRKIVGPATADEVPIDRHG